MNSRDLDADYQLLSKALAAERLMREPFASERHSIQQRINEKLANNLSSVLNNGWRLANLDYCNDSSPYGHARAVKNFYAVEIDFMPLPGHEYWAAFYLACPDKIRKVAATVSFSVEKLPVAMEKGETLLDSTAKKLLSKGILHWSTRAMTRFDLDLGWYTIFKQF